MQSIPRDRTPERLRIPARQSLAGNAESGSRIRGNNHHVATSSPRPRSICTCSNCPGSVKCRRHGYAVPSDKLRRRHANKEILRRALTPPNRGLTCRCWNFRPIPSRLSNMSMA
uniref:Uncharacterized protein n=1 Tax=Rhizophora mucronata TaxID=61149 RepID=A0A2P2L064_RHIMU